MSKRTLITNAQDEICQVLSCVFCNCQSLRSYIEELNASIERDTLKVNLDSDESDTDFDYIVQNLYIANQKKTPVPATVVEGLQCETVQAEEIIERAIQAILRSSEQMFDSSRQNVLVMGFSQLRPSGKGSLFRSLDSRAPSSVIQILLSPPWRKLYARLGHVLMYHFLSQTSLLLALNPYKKNSKRTKNSYPRSSRLPANFAVLQLAGVLPKSERPHFSTNVQKACFIRYKKSILNRTARNKYLPMVKAVTTSVGSNRNKGSNAIEQTRLSRSVVHRKSQLNDGLPSMHSLQRLSDNTSSAICLLHQIFAVSQSASALGLRKRQFKPARRMMRLVPILRNFIRHIKVTSFRDILGVQCPLPNWARVSGKCNRNLSDITKDFAKPRLVARFLIACVLRTFPSGLLGSKRNMYVLEHGIHEFIRKRTRNEAFNINKFVLNTGIKVTDVPWLYCHGPNGRRVCNPTDLNFRKKRLLVFLTWVFEGFLVPILLKSFYVTDSQVYGTRLLYYRREVWNKILDFSMRDALHKDRRMFSAISTKELAVGLMRRDKDLKQFGIRINPGQFITCFQVRFVPKAGGVRPVQRLMAKQWGILSALHRYEDPTLKTSTDPDELWRSLEQTRGYVKTFLSLAKKILHMCCRQQKRLLGSSVFGLDEIYTGLQRFKKYWVTTGRKQIFAVSFDISKSFDTVPIDLLANKIIPEILTQTRYVVLRFAVVTLNPVSGKVLRRFESHVCEEPGDEASFQDLVVNKLQRKYRRAVFIDLVRVQVIHREVLLSAIKECVTNNIVVLPRHTRRSVGTPYARQVRGLAQGNPLSPILTSLFYGYVEHQYLKSFLVDYNENKLSTRLFLRLIDDTIFASTEREMTTSFANAMVTGWDGVFGLAVNRTKTKANYDVRIGGKECLRMIPWCGLIIDLTLLEIRCDFSKYVPPRLYSLRQNLSIDFDLSPGRALEKKAMSCFHPKIHPVLLDANLNSTRTIALNIYQAALLTALKLYSCVLAMNVQNDTFVCHVARTTVLRFCELVRKSSFSQAEDGCKCKHSISTLQVTFLVETAFLWVVRQRFSFYRAGRAVAKLVAASCRRRVQELRTEISSITPETAHMLEAVTQCKTNDVLWKIRL